MGFSCDTFYRYQAAVKIGGIEALIAANRRKLNIKNRVEETTEAHVQALEKKQKDGDLCTVAIPDQWIGCYNYVLKQ